MSAIMEQIRTEGLRSDIPDFRTGDTITVKVKVTEGNKVRIQAFKGVVIQRRNGGIAETVTVRKISGNVAVERIFPLQSPNIDSILVDRKGSVHQSRIYTPPSLTHATHRAIMDEEGNACGPVRAWLKNKSQPVWHETNYLFLYTWHSFDSNCSIRPSLTR